MHFGTVEQRQLMCLMAAFRSSGSQVFLLSPERRREWFSETTQLAHSSIRVSSSAIGYCIGLASFTFYLIESPSV